MKQLLISFSLIFLYLLSCGNTYAQQGVTDFTQPGTHMPPLVYMSYRDTSAIVVKKARKRKSPATGTYTLTNGSDMYKGKGCFVMIFSPECSHCRETTTMLQANTDLYTQKPLLLITTSKMKDFLPDFYADMEMVKYPGIAVGIDSSQYVANTFLYQPLPQMNIYDSTGKLLKIYAGKIAADSLRKYIK